MSEKQIIDLLHSIRYEVMDLKVQMEAMKVHLRQHTKHQDEKLAEVIEASRRLSFSLDTAAELVVQFEEDDDDADKPLQN